MIEYLVKKISRSECSEYVLNIHYAKRFPSISYAFGLFKNNELIGIVTYGTPPSSTLRKGLAGENNIDKILELNRLCLRYNKKNEASFLVSKSLKMLPKNKVIISFADISQGHIGYVYQATNFVYYGLSAKRTDWALKSKPQLHGQTIADEFRGKQEKSKLMREKYGEDFYLKERPRKHRYIYIIGNKKFKKEIANQIKYKKEPYPKLNKQLES